VAADAGIPFVCFSVISGPARLHSALCGGMNPIGDKYSPEREVTPRFLETVAGWLDSRSEIFVVLRYLRAAGAKDYAFIKTRDEFAALVASVPNGTDIIVFRDPQLPLRGRVTAEFVALAKAQVADGAEYMFVRMRPERAADLRLFGEMGDTHATLAEDLGEESGEEVAFGACPRFIDADNDRMISASKGGIDGPR
jgi:hypothetical protein